MLLAIWHFITAMVPGRSALVVPWVWFEMVRFCAKARKINGVSKEVAMHLAPLGLELVEVHMHALADALGRVAESGDLWAFAARGMSRLLGISLERCGGASQPSASTRGDLTVVSVCSRLTGKVRKLVLTNTFTRSPCSVLRHEMGSFNQCRHVQGLCGAEAGQRCRFGCSWSRGAPGSGHVCCKWERGGGGRRGVGRGKTKFVRRCSSGGIAVVCVVEEPLQAYPIRASASATEGFSPARPAAPGRNVYRRGSVRSVQKLRRGVGDVWKAGEGRVRG